MQNCELTARVGSELHDARGWSGGADQRADPDPHSTPTASSLDFPIFPCPGEVDPCGSFDGGVISLSPPHLFSWPLARSRESYL